jgi:hypothetical protein
MDRIKQQWSSSILTLTERKPLIWNIKEWTKNERPHATATQKIATYITACFWKCIMNMNILLRTQRQILKISLLMICDYCTTLDWPPLSRLQANEIANKYYWNNQKTQKKDTGQN